MMELHPSRERGSQCRAGRGGHDSFHGQTGLCDGIEDERGCQIVYYETNCGQDNGRAWPEYSFAHPSPTKCTDKAMISRILDGDRAEIDRSEATDGRQENPSQAVYYGRTELRYFINK